MQKAFRISLFFFSLILTIFALINLIMPNIHLNELNLNDLLLILYFIGILGSGIFILFSNLDKISMWLNIILLLITIFTWIKYPTIGIVYTPFVVYSILNLLLLLVQAQTSSDHNVFNNSVADCESKAPVGSSPYKIAGLWTNARAEATRCF